MWTTLHVIIAKPINVMVCPGFKCLIINTELETGKLCYNIMKSSLYDTKMLVNTS